MELNEYLVPFNTKDINNEKETLIQKVIFPQNNKHKEVAEGSDIAIIGIPYSGLELKSDEAPQLIRKGLYELVNPFPDNLKIVDLGNVKKGKTFYDTLIGLRDVVDYLVKQEIFTVILGGTGLLKAALVEALYSEEGSTNYVSIEPSLSMYSEWSMLSEKISKNVAIETLGTQSYYLTNAHYRWLEEKKFTDVRLGKVRENMLNIEPVLRDAHVSTLSINSIRHSEAPAQERPMPNGFYGEEVAQLARFIGMADNTKVFGLFDLFANHDIHLHTSYLAGQIVWFVLEGFVNRTIEDPKTSPNIKKFIVNQNNPSYELIFYKSEKTERWWMEIPIRNSKNTKIFSCSYDDYRIAAEHDVPARWLNKFQRYNLDSN